MEEEEEESYESGRERRRRAVGDELVVAVGEPKWKMAAGGMGRGVKDRGMTMKSGEKIHSPAI